MKDLRGVLTVLVLSMSVAVAQSQPAKDKPTSDTPKQQKGAGDKAQKPATSPRSVLDRPMGERPDPFIVPAGTEIRVDIVEGKVVVPVRVGFATPIPALSKAAVKINRVYPPTYAESGAAQASVPVRYAEYGELTSVTIDGRTYAVQSDSVALGTPGSSVVTPGNSLGSSPHDVKFVLSVPLAIER